VIAELGGAGLGLVWGWLLGWNWTGAGRTALLTTAALANAALAAWLGGAWAALALVAAALLGAWLHITWIDELRARRART
jgi:NhaP-type Na+/H+ or K+/H+ antiporter